jgi:hypothetical protein
MDGSSCVKQSLMSRKEIPVTKLQKNIYNVFPLFKSNTCLSELDADEYIIDHPSIEDKIGSLILNIPKSIAETNNSIFEQKHKKS